MLTMDYKTNNDHSLYNLKEDGTTRWFRARGEIFNSGAGVPLCVYCKCNTNFSNVNAIIIIEYNGNQR